MITKKSIEDMYKLASKNGGKCLSKKYLGYTTNLKWECKEEHRWSMTPNSIIAGIWCPHCTGRKRKTLKDIQDIAEKKRGKCLSESYRGLKEKYRWECRHGHRLESTFHSAKNSWCPECKTVSTFFSG